MIAVVCFLMAGRVDFLWMSEELEIARNKKNNALEKSSSYEIEQGRSDGSELADLLNA